MELNWKGDDGYTRFGVNEPAKEDAKSTPKPKAGKDNSTEKPKG